MSGLILRVLIWVLPVVLLVLFMRYRQHVRSGGELLNTKELRSVQIAVASLLLLFVFAVYSVLSKEMVDREGTYVPPQLVDGKIVPGHIEDANADEGETTDTDDNGDG